MFCEGIFGHSFLQFSFKNAAKLDGFQTFVTPKHFSLIRLPTLTLALSEPSFCFFAEVDIMVHFGFPCRINLSGLELYSTNWLFSFTFFWWREDFIKVMAGHFGEGFTTVPIFLYLWVTPLTVVLWTPKALEVAL